MSLAAPATYDSQTAYAGGRLMCTSASLHWLVACARFGMAPACTPENMAAVMRAAAAAHADACREGAPDRGMLSHEEALAARGIPFPLCAAPLTGHALAAPDPAFAALGPLVHRDEIAAAVPPAAGLLVTAGGHTVAVWACADGRLAVFDPLPASVALCDAPALPAALRARLGPMREFDCTRISRRISPPSTPAASMRGTAPSRPPPPPRTRLPPPAAIRALR
jgi:hypothetical protein